MDRVSQEMIKNWPRKTGVYLMMNQYNKIIYIGKAQNLKDRVTSYFRESGSVKTRFLMKQTQALDYILTDTASEALLLEASLIKKHKPRYNIRLKDDKTYPYIRLSLKDDYPRFYLDRKFKKDGNLYFGPYSGGSALIKNITQFLNENYKIRDCRDGFMRSRKKPCLTHSMGYCGAPCVNKVSKKEYARQVEACLNFLKGQGVKEIKNLKKQMEYESLQENFEQALILKNRIQSIESVFEKQSVIDIRSKEDLDVFSIYGKFPNFSFEILHIRSGRWIGHHSHFEKQALWEDHQDEIEERALQFLMQYYIENLIPPKILLPKDCSLSLVKKIEMALKKLKEESLYVGFPLKKNEKQWMSIAFKNAQDKFETSLKKDQDDRQGLLDIQKIFRLKKLPRKIECYDISHFQSSFRYASKVVFEDGAKKSSGYRLYKLKSKNDDYEAMKEVLSRRLSHPEDEYPHLILVDGGRGQLQMAHQVLKKLNIQNIELASIAKNQKKKQGDKFYIYGRKNEIRMDESQRSFQILASIRNEAHRWAISHHRKKRDSQFTKSQLDLVEGVGTKIKIRLLEKFGSVDGIRQAKASDLEKVSGVSLKLAGKIIKTLKK